MGAVGMATQHGSRPHSGRAGLAAVALVAAVLTLGLPLLSYRSVTSLTQGQQQVGAGTGRWAGGWFARALVTFASPPAPATVAAGSCFGSCR